MNFMPTEEQRMAVEGFRRFLEAKIRPIADAHKDIYIEKEKMREILEMMLPYGMGGNGPIAEEFGGEGMDWLTFGMLYEQLARVSADIAITLLIQQMVAYTFEKCTNEKMRAEYLPRVLRAEI